MSDARPALPCPAGRRFFPGVRFAVVQLVDDLITWVTTLGWQPGSPFDSEHNIRALLAITLVCLICGATGALVVGNRMAFFSDSLAPCAFAGIALGALAYFLFGWE